MSHPMSHTRAMLVTSDQAAPSPAWAGGGELLVSNWNIIGKCTFYYRKLQQDHHRNFLSD